MSDVAVGNLEMVRRSLEGTVTVRFMPDAEARWCMVLVRPLHEQEARESLRRQGIGAWWPNYPWLSPARERKNGRLTRRMTLLSMLPGLIFCHCRLDEHFWESIDRAPGVINAALTPRGVVVLSDVDIVILHKIESGLNTPRMSAPIHNFKCGEKARIIEGTTVRWPFGKIVALARDGRISLEIALMGRKVTVTVLPHQIERI